MGSAAGPVAAADSLTGVLLDEMYPPALAERLRDAGHNVAAVLDVEVGLASRSDEDVFGLGGADQPLRRHRERRRLRSG